MVIASKPDDERRQTLDQKIRDLRFSKRYALGLPEAIAELDRLYAERDALDRQA